MEIRLVGASVEQLDVRATAVHLLGVLDGVLENKGLALVVKGSRELGGVAIVAGILGSLEASLF